MYYLWASLLVVTNLAWLFVTLLTLPGNWIMVVMAMLFAWWQWDKQVFSLWTLGAILLLAVIGEILEFLGSAVGAKTAGGTRWGGALALVGGIVGALIGTVAIPVPIFGSLMGACLGACIGAWGGDVATGRDMRAGMRSGVAAGAGHLAGSVAKFAVGCVIWLIIAVAVFWN